jgi:hypothetical protein
MPASAAQITALQDAIKARGDAGDVAALLSFATPGSHVDTDFGRKPTGQAWSPNGAPDCLTKGIADFVADYSILPVGTILAFSGATPLPSGWHVCDGNAGTPNLVGRFLRGAVAAGGTGGSDTQSHGINHDHAAFTSGASSAANTGAAGAHEHLTAFGFDSANLYYTGGDGAGEDLPRFGSSVITANRATAVKGAEAVGATRLANTESEADHAHTMAHDHPVDPPAFTGTSGSADNRPAYYEVIFIMKIA